MELNIYDVIKRPIVTSKSVELFRKLGQITFEVNTSANKVMIRNAVEKIWNVQVADIRVINLAGKNKVFARREFTSPDKKKAIVTLKKGYKIDIPGMFEAVGSAGDSAESMGSESGKE